MPTFARVFAFLTGREPGAPNKTAAPTVARRASDARRAVLPPRARENRKRRIGATTKAGTDDGADDESDGDDSEGVLSAFRQEQIDAEEQERARWRSRLQRVKAEAADIARELLELLNSEGFPIELFDNNDLAAVNEFAEPDLAQLYRKTDEGVKSYPVYLEQILYKGRLDSNYSLEPGDVVSIPERRF